MTRRPLEDVMSFAKDLASYIDGFSTRTAIAGSVRRRTETVKDIEVLCIPIIRDGVNTLWKALDDVVPPENWIKRGGKYRQFKHDMEDGEPPLSVDVFTSLPESWGYQYFLRTGPWKWNRAAMVSLKDSPFLFKDGRVKDKDSGRVIRVEEESDFFNLIGIQYVHPSSRSEKEWRKVFRRHHGWGKPKGFVEEDSPTQISMLTWDELEDSGIAAGKPDPSPPRELRQWTWPHKPNHSQVWVSDSDGFKLTPIESEEAQTYLRVNSGTMWRLQERKLREWLKENPDKLVTHRYPYNLTGVSEPDPPSRSKGHIEKAGWENIIFTTDKYSPGKVLRSPDEHQGLPRGVRFKNSDTVFVTEGMHWVIYLRIKLGASTIAIHVIDLEAEYETQ